MKVKILGIAGTPIMGGNCEKMVKVALKAAEEVAEVETGFINLADKNIEICKQCQWCIQNRSRCTIKDDVNSIHDQMFASDGLILGAPTYMGLISTQLIHLFTRGREEMFFARRMQNKIGAALTLGWFGIGMDRALDCINQLILSWFMLPIGPPIGTATVSTAWKGERATYMEHGVLDNKVGVLNAELVGRQLAETTKIFTPARAEWFAALEQKRKEREKKFVGGVLR
jgi:multimeric flavodoxin WrbA